MFCPGCGKEVSNDALVCPGCGKPLKESVKQKSKTVTLLLAFFIGGWGLHSFYLNDIKTGCIHIALTVADIILGVFGLTYLCLLIEIPHLIWRIVELVNIGSGKTKDANGFDLK